MKILQSEIHARQTPIPKLTISIPTWNRVSELSRQLDSIADAFGDELEVIVCDNGSTDDTWNYLNEEVARNRLSLKCVRNPVNLGMDANYLRSLEAASGEWTWLVGDDDKINFNIFKSEILKLLPEASGDLILLSNSDELGYIEGTVVKLSSDMFFDQSLDLSCARFLKLSRVLCRTIEAVKFLPVAYANGMGSLHSYAFVYGQLFNESGIEVVYSFPLFYPDPYDKHRWNLFDGHFGAWSTNLIVFNRYQKLVREREKRIRGFHLFSSAHSKLYATNSDGNWFFFVLSELPLKYKIKLVLLYFRSRLQGLATGSNG
jgi:glycosyltransferase involved in cell wall biosynthesis